MHSLEIAELQSVIMILNASDMALRRKSSVCSIRYDRFDLLHKIKA
jgi:hypothetical protein